MRKFARTDSSSSDFISSMNSENFSIPIDHSISVIRVIAVMAIKPECTALYVCLKYNVI